MEHETEDDDIQCDEELAATGENVVVVPDGGAVRDAYVQSEGVKCVTCITVPRTIVATHDTDVTAWDDYISKALSTDEAPEIGVARSFSSAKM